MDCPVCKVPLIVVEREKIELDYCLVCKGIWFDAGELELLPQALKLPVSLPEIRSLPVAPSKELPRPCPRCSKKMDKVRLAEALVDRCIQGHGLWFDWGEVGQVLERSVTGAAAEAAAGGSGMIQFLGETIRLKNSTS